MLDPHLTGTRTQCEAYLDTCNKALKLPIRSEHVGGGRHVTIPDEPFDKHGNRNPGWTTAWTDVRRHPDRKEYAVKILPNAPTDALDVAEVQTLRDAEETAVELDETWVAVARAEPKGKP